MRQPIMADLGERASDSNRSQHGYPQPGCAANAKCDENLVNGLRRRLHQHARNIVVPAGFLGGFDQPRAVVLEGQVAS